MKKKDTLQIQFGKCIEFSLIILDFVRTCVFVLLFQLAKSNMPMCRSSIICYLTLSFSDAGKVELMHCLITYTWTGPLVSCPR